MLLILSFPCNHSRGKNSCKVLQRLIIVDGLCDEFLSELPRRIKVLLHKGFQCRGLEYVGDQKVAWEGVSLRGVYFTREHQVKLRGIGDQQAANIFQHFKVLDLRFSRDDIALQNRDALLDLILSHAVTEENEAGVDAFLAHLVRTLERL